MQQPIIGLGREGRGDRVERLFYIFVELCLLRAKPQDLPVSVFLLLITALLGLLTGTLAAMESFGGVAVALTAQLMDTLLLLGLLMAALRLAGRAARFLQTGSALCGTGVLINMASIPAQLLIPDDPSTAAGGDLWVLVYLILIGWALVVMGHIIRHAFELPLWAGIFAALNYFLIITWLIQDVFDLG